MSIRSRESNDLDCMRRLFREIASPQRVTALRDAQTALTGRGFVWRDVYISTAEPGEHYPDLDMSGRQGDHFMARAPNAIVIGLRADLPAPEPPNGARFAMTAREW